MAHKPQKSGKEPQMAKPTDEQEYLKEHPFLAAAIEDYSFATRLLETPKSHLRHSICLMHDSLEFLFYEILLSNNVDIYSSGQNTIGFEKGLAECKNIGISLPLIGSIRNVQKLRGDAKHHAQSPNEREFDQICRSFRLLFSIICYENFGEHIQRVLLSNGVMGYHLALFELYRRERNHRWDKALELGIRALIHKRRAIYSTNDDFRTHRATATKTLLAILNSTAVHAVTAREAKAIKHLVDKIEEVLGIPDIRTAGDMVGEAFSKLDFVSPTIFDISRAQKITDLLYMPINSTMMGMWTMESIPGIQSVCRESPHLVKKFGNPRTATFDDHYSSWWEFAAFDGDSWQLFHLDSEFRISSQAFGNSNTILERSKDFATVVCNEFKKAAAV